MTTTAKSKASFRPEPCRECGAYDGKHETWCNYPAQEVREKKEPAYPNLKQILEESARETLKLAESLGEGGRRMNRREIGLAEGAINGRIVAIMNEATMFAVANEEEELDSSLDYLKHLMKLKADL